MADKIPQVNDDHGSGYVTVKWAAVASGDTVFPHAIIGNPDKIVVSFSTGSVSLTGSARDGEDELYNPLNDMTMTAITGIAGPLTLGVLEPMKYIKPAATSGTPDVFLSYWAR